MATSERCAFAFDPDEGGSEPSAERLAGVVDDRYPIDLRGSRIDRLRIGDSYLGQPLDVTGASVGACLVEHSRFGATCSLTGAQFGGRVTFQESTFTDTVDAESALFGGDAEFVGVTIDGTTSFEDTTFTGRADFRECVWNDDAMFVSATFEGDTVFDGAEFNGGANVLTDDADFTNARFTADVSFEVANFRFGNFTDATFESAVNFADATFDRGAHFADATFEAAATFDRTTFDADADFSGSAFRGETTVEEADFDGDAVFRGVEFDAPVTFAGSTFRGGSRLLEDDANFVDARFADDVDCHFVEFRYAEFDGAVFEGDVNCRQTEFVRGVSCPDAVFEGEVDCYRARFSGQATFTDTRFEGAVSFDEAVFDDDAAFDAVEMAASAGFHGVEFRGGTKEIDDADFAGAVFGGPVDFGEAEFRFASFVDATFDDPVSFDQTEFQRGASFDGATSAAELAFEEAVFNGRTRFTEMRVDTVDFSETTFDDDALFVGTQFADARFYGSAFNGGTRRHDDADFEATAFDGPVDFREVECRYANFENAEFGAELRLNGTEFTGGATFDDATFHGDLRCYQVQFDAVTTFDRCRTDATAVFDESIFDSDASFSAFEGRGETTFRGTEFNGGANDHIDDAKFIDARFTGPVNFTTAQFRRGNFDGAEFGSSVTFEHARFRLGASFDGSRIAERMDCSDASFSGDVYFEPEATGDVAVVDMTNAELTDGRVVETGSVYYDLTETRVGDIRLEQTEESINVFDRFLFRNTEFDGFDFSVHRDYLAQNEWLIHDVVTNREINLDRFDLRAKPDQLETTYLKARNSAQATGDNKAASEFFILEYVYRRKQYVEIIRDAGLTNPMASLTAGGRWAANYFFDLTCGYGERPSKVVLASVAIILAFSGVYLLLGIDLASSGYLAMLVYSFQAFTSLVLGTPQGSSPLVNLLTATEGFTGAFFIALFVFALTRSLNR